MPAREMEWAARDAKAFCVLVLRSALSLLFGVRPEPLCTLAAFSCAVCVDAASKARSRGTASAQPAASPLAP
eukprot:523753-Alexandrium_andersonii.AAC.1